MKLRYKSSWVALNSNLWPGEEVNSNIWPWYTMMDTQLKTVNYKLGKILRDTHPNQICSIDREFELVFLLFLLILTMPILDMMAKKGTVWVCHCLRGRLNRPTKDHPPLMSPSPSPSSPAAPQQHHHHQNHHRPCWSSQWTMRDASLASQKHIILATGGWISKGILPSSLKSEAAGWKRKASSNWSGWGTALQHPGELINPANPLPV